MQALSRLIADWPMWFHPIDLSTWNWLSVHLIQIKPGGLDLSRSCLNWDSRSQHRQIICLNSWENLDIFKKFVFRVKKSWSRFPDFSQHQCPDTKVSIKIEKLIKTWKFHHFSIVCLDLNREVSGFLHIYCRDVSIRQDFLSFLTQNV